MKQLLCLSHTPWQARPNRTQQLLARMSDIQILFFEPPVPRGLPKPKQGRKLRPHITVYTLPSPMFARWGHSTIPWRDQQRGVDFIKKLLAHHCFHEPVLWCTSPEHAVHLNQLAYRGLVYDCYREWDEVYLDLESDLACCADVVFAASPGLVQRIFPCNDSVALLPNGVNDRMFTRPGLTVPLPLANLSSPILGRVGDLNSRVELEPMLLAARTHPQWTFLLMGRVTPAVRSRLRRYPNVVLAGPVHPVELPDYLFACDALFDLFHTDAKGSDIIPPRMFEYLASGKPIVTMIDPEQIEPFPDVVYTAYDPIGFVRRCRRALEEDSSLAAPRRQAYARCASWSNRAKSALEILDRAGLF